MTIHKLGMDSAHRISKDTSGRKNDGKADMRVAVESRAGKVAEKAYLDAMIQGYEEKIDGIQNEHELAMMELKSAFNDEQAALQAQQHSVMEEATQNAFRERSSELDRLQSVCSELNNEKFELKKHYENRLAEAESRVQQIAAEKSGLLSGITRRNEEHMLEINRLNAKLKVGPNSWYRIDAQGKGRKTRTYIRRPFAPFKSALEELAKHIGKDLAVLKFDHNGRGILGTDIKSLQQLGFRVGDSVNIEI